MDEYHPEQLPVDVQDQQVFEGEQHQDPRQFVAQYEQEVAGDGHEDYQQNIAIEGDQDDDIRRLPEVEEPAEKKTKYQPLLANLKQLQSQKYAVSNTIYSSMMYWGKDEVWQAVGPVVGPWELQVKQMSLKTDYMHQVLPVEDIANLGLLSPMESNHTLNPVEVTTHNWAWYYSRHEKEDSTYVPLDILKENVLDKDRGWYSDILMEGRKLEVVRTKEFGSEDDTDDEILLFSICGDIGEKCMLSVLKTLPQQKQDADELLADDEFPRYCRIYSLKNELKSRIFQIALHRPSFPSKNQFRVLSRTNRYVDITDFIQSEDPYGWQHSNICQIFNLDPKKQKQYSSQLDTKQCVSRARITHASWNPWFSHELAITDEDGYIKVSDLNRNPTGFFDCIHQGDYHDGRESMVYGFNRFMCEYAHNPRSIYYVLGQQLNRVDLRSSGKKGGFQNLHKLQDQCLFYSVGVPRTWGFEDAGQYGNYYLWYATNVVVGLLDVRNPNVPVMQWTHQQQFSFQPSLASMQALGLTHMNQQHARNYYDRQVVGAPNYIDIYLEADPEQKNSEGVEVIQGSFVVGEYLGGEILQTRFEIHKPGLTVGEEFLGYEEDEEDAEEQEQEEVVQYLQQPYDLGVDEDEEMESISDKDSIDYNEAVSYADDGENDENGAASTQLNGNAADGEDNEDTTHGEEQMQEEQQGDQEEEDQEQEEFIPRTLETDYSVQNHLVTRTQYKKQKDAQDRRLHYRCHFNQLSFSQIPALRLCPNFFKQDIYFNRLGEKRNLAQVPNSFHYLRSKIHIKTLQRKEQSGNSPPTQLNSAEISKLVQGIPDLAGVFVLYRPGQLTRKIRQYLSDDEDINEEQQNVKIRDILVFRQSFIGDIAIDSCQFLDKGEELIDHPQPIYQYISRIFDINQSFFNTYISPYLNLQIEDDEEQPDLSFLDDFRFICCSSNEFWREFFAGRLSKQSGIEKQNLKLNRLMAPQQKPARLHDLSTDMQRLQFFFQSTLNEFLRHMYGEDSIEQLGLDKQWIRYYLGYTQNPQIPFELLFNYCIEVNRTEMVNTKPQLVNCGKFLNQHFFRFTPFKFSMALLNNVPIPVLYQRYVGDVVQCVEEIVEEDPSPFEVPSDESTCWQYSIIKNVQFWNKRKTCSQLYSGESDDDNQSQEEGEGSGKVGLYEDWLQGINVTFVHLTPIRSVQAESKPLKVKDQILQMYAGIDQGSFAVDVKDEDKQARAQTNMEKMQESWFSYYNQNNTQISYDALRQQLQLERKEDDDEADEQDDENQESQQNEEMAMDVD